MTEGKSLYRLSNSFPYLLNRVGVRIGELFSQRLKTYGMTLPMYRVLASLWERPNQCWTPPNSCHLFGENER